MTVYQECLLHRKDYVSGRIKVPNSRSKKIIMNSVLINIFNKLEALQAVGLNKEGRRQIIVAHLGPVCPSAEENLVFFKAFEDKQCSLYSISLSFYLLM